MSVVHQISSMIIFNIRAMLTLNFTDSYDRDTTVQFGKYGGTHRTVMKLYHFSPIYCVHFIAFIQIYTALTISTSFTINVLLQQVMCYNVTVVPRILNIAFL